MEWALHVVDPSWAVQVRLGDGGFFVEFQLYGLQGVEEDGSPVFRNGKSEVGDSPWEFEGAVKWDGCMNLMSHPKCMAHVCGPSSLGRLFAAFQKVYELAEPMMPNAMFGE